VAVDTRNRRASVIGLGLSALLVLPAPDGALDLGDRQQVAACYRGIDAAVQVARVSDVTITGSSVETLTLTGTAVVDVAVTGSYAPTLAFTWEID
jgi:hypothetical protein